MNVHYYIDQQTITVAKKVVFFFFGGRCCLFSWYLLNFACGNLYRALPVLVPVPFSVLASGQIHSSVWIIIWTNEGNFYSCALSPHNFLHVLTLFFFCIPVHTLMLLSNFCDKNYAVLSVQMILLVCLWFQVPVFISFRTWSRPSKQYTYAKCCHSFCFSFFMLLYVIGVQNVKASFFFSLCSIVFVLEFSAIVTLIYDSTIQIGKYIWCVCACMHVCVCVCAS